MTDRELDGRVGRRVYERVGRCVFAIAGLPWTWERRALAAALAVSPLSYLSHHAAAHWLGFDGFGECPIELTVPRGIRARSELAEVHTTTYLHPLDVVRRGRFSVSSGARTIIDLCASAISAEKLSAAIGCAVRDGHTSVAFLRKRLTSMRGRGRHGIVLLDRVLEGPITHSHLERAFLRLLQASGLPMPQTQAIMRGERVIRVDFVWPDAMLVVEVMGHRFHVTKEDLLRDAERRNELQEMGYLVIEFTTEHVANRPEYCMTRVRRNLAARSGSV